MKLVHMIITLLSCVTHVTSQFQCQGTCYSGSFPKNKNVIKGKHLRGSSYKNITTDVPQTCFSTCINDCRCKAFQMKDVRCELLDKDKTCKAADFISETGYVYYDLHQTIYNGKSHMGQPAGVCYNGCCRTQPCMNGATCVEHCENPKEKFTCKCRLTHFGKVCESKTGHSCMDILKNSLLHGLLPLNGIYNLIHKDTEEILPRYCAFDSRNKAWTLIESFSLGNRQIFKHKAFHQDYPRNDLSPNWNDYRLSLSNMQYIQTKATMFRATCDFPNRDSLIPDFLLGYKRDFDIINSGDHMKLCINFTYMNFRGHEFNWTSAPVFHKGNLAHLHLDISKNFCNFKVPGTIFDEDDFGFYGTINPNTKCTATSQSTTQWWLGEQQ